MVFMVPPTLFKVPEWFFNCTWFCINMDPWKCSTTSWPLLMVLKLEVMVPPTMRMVPLTFFQDSTTKCLRLCCQYFYSFINTNIIQGYLIAHSFVCTWFHPHCSQFHQTCMWFYIDIHSVSSHKMFIFHEFVQGSLYGSTTLIALLMVPPTMLMVP